MYFEYLRSGDARPLSGIFYHNGMDILSLAALFIFVNDLLADPLQLQSIDSLDLLAIARAHEEQGLIIQAIGLYERAITQGLPPPYFTETLHHFAQLNRRQGSWDHAIRLWMKGANEYQHLEACVELAKFYEHRQRNYTEALIWTQTALQFLFASDRIPAKKIVLQKELERRIARLVKKNTQSPL
jgi:tetratricopeptide (TPR) repeat protein